MSSRESILKAIKTNKPELLPLPTIDLEVFNEEINLIDTFVNTVQQVGGRAQVLNSISDLDEEIKKLYPNAKQIISYVDTSKIGTISISKETDPHGLDTIDLVIIKGELGVAENGAVWIEENHFAVRVLPFITNDLVLVVSKDSICLHLHDAYEIISNRERTFGLFLSGPSKTADIEQCLVIGAQGAMSLTVFLV